ncbi:MAG: DNA mismatch repair protein MutS [Chloroflexia bacterium]|nr:DNA mismatch repair protein MutS [Chloroflexia bacterium]
MATSPDTTTPIRRQYLSIKRQYPDVVVFFRLGDFYETFDDDARLASDVLDIVLTSREMGRGNRVDMAGIPYHAADGYIAKLLAAGHKVAIAEQVSEPTGKGLVDRRVTSVVTPGTATNPAFVQGTANTFIAAALSDGSRAGIAFADVTTGEFATTTIESASQPELTDAVRREMLRISPAEIVAPESDPLLSTVNPEVVRSGTRHSSWRLDDATEALKDHFNVISLEPFGCDDKPLATRAAGALLSYLQDTQMNGLRQITALYSYGVDRYMSLDPQTRRNLELTESTSRSSDSSLLKAVDATQTPLGARMLQRWLGQPLLDRSEIVARHNGVEWFCTNAAKRARLRETLRGIADIERIINRVANMQAGPREVARLGLSLERLPKIRDILAADELPEIIEEVPNCDTLAIEIKAALADEPPALLSAGGAIRDGFNSQLDGLRRTLADDRSYIAGLETTERQTTGIKNLKVGYNKVFGYFLEISHANRATIPERYIRKQTLVNAERYVTPELKEAEQRVLSAEERISAAEEEAFRELLGAVAAQADLVRVAARAVATLDVVAGLAEIAANRGYVRPEMVEDDTIEIEGGRHPIIERELPGGAFVANDTRLSAEAGRIAILTGPNMAGKSTYLRQVALIVLLAQVGSFVPANRATLGIVDRIFTRIGAQDDLVSGQSTFMVEMLETATILNHATARSLVVLDEIGRGTSTYDGLAIATSIVEYIHNTPRLGCKTLFATHYHELTALADVLPAVRNYRVDVLESGDQITFLHRVIPGGADRSYGVYVAQLAGMPRGVVRRAADILADLEHDSGSSSRRDRKVEAVTTSSSQSMQMALFGANHPALEQLQTLEIDALTPLDALTVLYELQRLVKQRS